MTNRTELEIAQQRARLHDLARAEALRLRREAIAALFNALFGGLVRGWRRLGAARPAKPRASATIAA